MSFWDKFYIFKDKEFDYKRLSKLHKKELNKEVKDLKSVDVGKDNLTGESIFDELDMVEKNYKFSQSSLDKLNTCHPDIQKVMHMAIKYYDFTVLEGSRSKEKQNEYFMKGTSKVKYPHSYHNTKTYHIMQEFLPTFTEPHTDKYCSLAIDIAPYPINWEDLERFERLSRVIKICANTCKIPLENGWDLWGFDYPHWQLTSYRKS